MDRCPKCGIPALQVVDGECIECRLFQRHSDPEPVTYADKLKALLSHPGEESFFSAIPKLWSGSIAVRNIPVPKGKAVKYLYFDKGNVITMVIHFGSNAHEDSKLNMIDMESDAWHLIPADMEFSSPVPNREDRAIRVLNAFETSDRLRFFAHCEHAETWMHQ